ncbi:hypothetical protein PFISCL1PPCAC_26137, partial [Pristionchus fissidentatus]
KSAQTIEDRGSWHESHEYSRPRRESSMEMEEKTGRIVVVVVVGGLREVVDVEVDVGRVVEVDAAFVVVVVDVVVGTVFIDVGFSVVDEVI